MRTISFIVIDRNTLHKVTDLQLSRKWRSAYVIQPNPTLTMSDIDIRVTIMDDLDVSQGDVFTGPEFGHVRYVCLFKPPCENIEQYFQEWFDEALSHVEYKPLMVPTYKDGVKHGEEPARFDICPISLNMKALRVAAGLSREDMVEYLGMSYPNYLEAEQQRRKVSDFIISKVKRSHNVGTQRLNHVPSKFKEIIESIHSLPLEDRVFIETAIERMSVTHHQVSNTRKGPFKLR